ncbi:homoserine kinase [Isobaculum melis]|uniref:Homoserine kinase n=1 Tax=Isobaculum melis TaxID=142588 RepID=A0A1H9TS40_9LACT|nr:homoserine kinase [Isobaculum melis]SER99503.1 homoserine kinase [Isobaculum melis]
MRIQVPATTANLGPGFDCLGLALNLFLTLDIGSPQTTWLIEHQLGADIPTDETNLIVATALSIQPDLQPHHLVVHSDIPTARGLGSSSSAIVAGIELANQLGQLELTTAEKLALAVKKEGHPDNVAPAILGQFVIATSVADQVYYQQGQFPDCGIIVAVPPTELLTTESRGLLPAALPYKEAVAGASIGHVMIAALLNQDLVTAGQLLEADLFHEPYRKKILPHFDIIKDLAHQFHAYGTCISGAGPSVLTLLPTTHLADFQQALQCRYPDFNLLNLSMNQTGVTCIN